MLPVGFKAAGDLTLVCGHQESQPKDVLSLAGAGCLQYLASAALSLHLLRYLKQTFSFSVFSKVSFESTLVVKPQ